MSRQQAEQRAQALVSAINTLSLNISAVQRTLTQGGVSFKSSETTAVPAGSFYSINTLTQIHNTLSSATAELGSIAGLFAKASEAEAQAAAQPGEVYQPVGRTPVERPVIEHPDKTVVKRPQYARGENPAIIPADEFGRHLHREQPETAVTQAMQDVHSALADMRSRRRPTPAGQQAPSNSAPTKTPKYAVADLLGDHGILKRLVFMSNHGIEVLPGIEVKYTHTPAKSTTQYVTTYDGMEIYEESILHYGVMDWDAGYYGSVHGNPIELFLKPTDKATGIQCNLVFVNHPTTGPMLYMHNPVETSAGENKWLPITALGSSMVDVVVGQFFNALRELDPEYFDGY